MESAEAAAVVESGAATTGPAFVVVDMHDRRVAERLPAAAAVAGPDELGQHAGETAFPGIAADHDSLAGEQAPVHILAGLGGEQVTHDRGEVSVCPCWGVPPS